MVVAAKRNRRTEAHHRQFAHLDKRIQSLAKRAFRQFVANPAHPSLRWHDLDDCRRGSHMPGSFSVSITMAYRAIYFVDERTDTNVWYWIGSHADYDQFVGRKS